MEKIKKIRLKKWVKIVLDVIIISLVILAIILSLKEKKEAVDKCYSKVNDYNYCLKNS